jgi:hypothetical protein
MMTRSRSLHFWCAPFECVPAALASLRVPCVFPIKINKDLSVTTDRRARRASKCANPDCNKRIRFTRSDAEYCSNACKQAHYRARQKAKAAAEALFKIKQSTDNFESHQRIATELYSKVRGIEVVATNAGILVAETAPGAREQAASQLPEWQQTLVGPEAVPAMLRLAPVPRYADSATRRAREDRDFCYRVAQRDFLAAMKRSARSISLFTYDGELDLLRIFSTTN